MAFDDGESLLEVAMLLEDDLCSAGELCDSWLFSVLARQDAVPGICVC